MSFEERPTSCLDNGRVGSVCCDTGAVSGTS